MGNATQRVQFYEGMLLEPQHFQQMQGDIAVQMLRHLEIAAPFFWGIQSLEIDATALLSGIYRINQLDAIMPDGSILKIIPTMENVPEINLASVCPPGQSTPTLLSLGILRWREDAATTSGDFPRYSSTQEGPFVDENTGENGIYIPKLSLKIEILTGEIPSRYLSFPLATALHDGEGYILTEFIPPCLDLQKTSALGVKCGTLAASLREKVNFLSQKLRSPDWTDADPLFEAYTDRLKVLVPLLPRLEVLLETQTVHPFTMYRELCGIAGLICSLVSGQIPPLFGAYNHDDLLGTFTPVLTFVTTILDTIRDMATEVPFTQTDRKFSLKTQAGWMFEDSWILALYYGEGATHESLADWLSGAIIVSEEFLEGAREKRVLGAARSIVPQVSGLGLLPENGIMLVQVPQDSTFINPTSTLVLLNTNDTNDTRPPKVALYTATAMP